MQVPYNMRALWSPLLAKITIMIITATEMTAADQWGDNKFTMIPAPKSSFDRMDPHPAACSDEARMYPHPEDCTKFTRCVNKRLIIFSCPPLTAFDPETQICAWRVGKNGCGGKLGYSVPERVKGMTWEGQRSEERKEIVPYIAKYVDIKRTDKVKKSSDVINVVVDPVTTAAESGKITTPVQDRSQSEISNTLNDTYNVIYSQVYNSHHVISLENVVEGSKINVASDDIDQDFTRNMSIPNYHDVVSQNYTERTSPHQLSLSDKDKQQNGVPEPLQPVEVEFQKESLWRTIGNRYFTGNSSLEVENVTGNSTQDFTRHIVEPDNTDATNNSETTLSNTDALTNLSTDSYSAETKEKRMKSSQTDSPIQQYNMTKERAITASPLWNLTNSHITSFTLSSNTTKQAILQNNDLEIINETRTDAPIFTSGNIQIPNKDLGSQNVANRTNSALEHSAYDYTSISMNNTSINGTIFNLPRDIVHIINKTKDSNHTGNHQNIEMERINTTTLDKTFQEDLGKLEKKLDDENSTHTSPKDEVHTYRHTIGSVWGHADMKLSTTLPLNIEQTVPDLAVSSSVLDGFFSFIRPVPYFRALENVTMGSDKKNTTESSQQRITHSNNSSQITSTTMDSVLDHSFSKSISAAVSADFSPNETSLKEMHSSTRKPEKQAEVSGKGKFFFVPVPIKKTAQNSTKDLSDHLQNKSDPHEVDSRSREVETTTNNATDSFYTTKSTELFIRLPLLSKSVTNYTDSRSEIENKVYIKDIAKMGPMPFILGGLVKPRRAALTSRPTNTLESAQEGPFSESKKKFKGDGDNSRSKSKRRDNSSPRPLYVKLYNFRKNGQSLAGSDETGSDALVTTRKWYDILKQRRRLRIRGLQSQSSNLSPEVPSKMNFRPSRRQFLPIMPKLWERQYPAHKFQRDEFFKKTTSSQSQILSAKTRAKPEYPAQYTGSVPEEENQNQSKMAPAIVSFKSAPYMVKGDKRPFQCPFNDGHFTDPNNCAVFYHCDNGVAYRRDCPKGQIFHRAALACVTASVALPCSPQQQEQQQQPQGNQQQHPQQRLQTSLPDAMANTITSYISDNVQCPERHGLFRDPKSCSHYLECSDGEPVRRQCMAGTVFDPSLATCTWSKFGPGCERQVDPEKPLSEMGGNLAGNEEQSSEHDMPGQSTKDHLRDHFMCQRDGFFRDKGRCEVYYFCADGEALRLTCEPGTSFDPALNMCVWTQLVPGCDDLEDTLDSTGDLDQGAGKQTARTSEKGEEATPLLRSAVNTGFSCPERTGLFPLPGDCEFYISCVDGHSAILRCLSGTAFNKQTTRCVVKSMVPECADQTESFVCPSLHGVYPDEVNCSAFIHCFQGIPYRHFCQPGTAYSPEARSCTWKYLVPQCWRHAALTRIKKVTIPVPDEIKSSSFDAVKNWLKQNKYYGRNISTSDSYTDGKRQATQDIDNGRNLKQNSKLLASFSNYFGTDHSRFDNTDPSRVVPYEDQRGNPNLPTWRADSSSPAHRLPAHIRQYAGHSNRRFSDTVSQRFSNRNIDWKSWGWSHPRTLTEEQTSEKTYDVPLTSLRSDQYLMQPQPHRQGLPEFQCPPVKDGFYRDDVLCDIFHRCVMGERFTFVCPPGTFFRLEGNFCDHSAIMPDCNQDGVRISALSRFPRLRTSGSQPKFATPALAPQAWSYRPYSEATSQRATNQEGYYDFQPRLQTRVAETSSPPTCPSQSGLFPHPDNCRQFLFCAHSVPLVLTCPTTLLYNSRTLTCDFPATVVCGSRVAFPY
ncbi:hypothetical protein RRG08_020544 [Elysia crispata]|uniref:Chitin-binding type-2 domain-containing protein n=1 Tax=Elysia crispata TaxID=231223 RepID=A0AAE1E100_9GAST|nr:hypothetical protein RRG08_020544 [Elysia crispata]